MIFVPVTYICNSKKIKRLIMRKQLFILALAVSSVSFGQYIDLEKRNLEPAPANTAFEVQNRLDAKKAQISADKTNGGPVSQWMSHYDPVLDLYGTGTGSPLTFYIDPTFVDSTVVTDFGTPSSVSRHGVGIVFDPSSEVFTLLGQDYLSDNDSYTLDSIAVQGVYDIVTSGLSGNTGDKLRFEIVWDQPSNTAGDAFNGVQFNPNTFNNQPDPLPVIGFQYSGDPLQGDKGSLDFAGKVTVEYDLTTSDSASQIVIVPVNGALGQMIPAGAVVGISVKFIPGYNWTTGDTYFVGNGGTTTATINSWRAFLAAASSASDDEGYFMESLSYDPNSWANSQILGTNSRYNAWPSAQNFLNEIYLPQNRGYLIDCHITANSSIGIEENSASNINVYPNPSNGLVKVNFGELSSGTYNVRLLNIVGQDVFNQDVEISAGTVESFNFEGLDKGVYLMNITGNGLNTVRKITLR